LLLRKLLKRFPPHRSLGFPHPSAALGVGPAGRRKLRKFVELFSEVKNLFLQIDHLACG
jgi:hypothetical protein